MTANYLYIQSILLQCFICAVKV